MPESPFDFDAWLDDYTPRVETIRVGIDYRLVAEHDAVEAELRQMVPRVDSDPDAARRLLDRLLELEEEIRQSGREFRLQAVTWEQWADLMRDHPPTEEQRAEHKLLDHNPDTFPIAAIAATVVEPKLTEAQVRKARSRLGNADFSRLWEMTLLVNREVGEPPKSPLAGVAQIMNAGSSRTQRRAASRARSSSGGRKSPGTTTRKAS